MISNLITATEKTQQIKCRRIARTLLPLSVLLISSTLSGCLGQSKDNATEPGLVVQIGEFHHQASPPSTNTTLSASAAKVVPLSTPIDNMIASSSEDRAGLSHHSLRDGAGNRVSVYQAYIVIDEIELVPCLSVASLFERTLSSLVSTAHAHAGHGSEPIGGRALDQANVIDLLTQDEYILPLGAMSIAPGDYCSLSLSISALRGAGYGVPQIDTSATLAAPTLTDRLFALRTDYCAETDLAGDCTLRVNQDFDDNGQLNSVRRTLSFPSALQLSRELRTGFVVIGIAYNDWLKGLDIKEVVANADALNTLLDNIADSLYIEQKGLGALPQNIP